MNITKKILEAGKTVYYLLLAVGMLIFVTYVSISWNKDAFDIDDYLQFVLQVALYSFILDFILIVAIRIFSKNNISHILDKIFDFFGYVLGISLAGILGSMFFAWYWVDFFGALFLWGFFLWLYLIITYKVIIK